MIYEGVPFKGLCARELCLSREVAGLERGYLERFDCIHLFINISEQIMWDKQSLVEKIVITGYISKNTGQVARPLRYGHVRLA